MDLTASDFFLISLGALVIGFLIPLILPAKSPAILIGGLIPALVAAGAGLISAGIILLNQTSLQHIFYQLLPGVNFSIYIDSLAAFFLLVIFGLYLAVAVYTWGYCRKFTAEQVKYLLALGNLFVLAMVMVIIADNALTFLLVWEAMSLVSYFLVVFDHQDGRSRQAGFIYLVMTHIGTVFICLAFLLLYRYNGSLDFAAFRAGAGQVGQGAAGVIFILALIGFGTKAGIIPLHVWLPRAHPVAPSNISALMSGVMIKTGIYGLLRVTFDFLGPGPIWWGYVVLALGAVTALLGVMYALMEHDLKRLLAQHSVENIGIIMMGVGAALIFRSLDLKLLTALALTAGLYHVLNHAIFKGLLFLGAGAVDYATHTRDIEKLGGLIKRMPWTAVFFLIGSISISALPPFNGFISEWLTFQSLLQLGLSFPGSVIQVVPLVIAALLGLTGALAAACFVKAFGITFLALPRSTRASAAKEVPRSMLVGMGLLAIACLVLGVLPGAVVRLIDPINAGLVGVKLANGLSSSMVVLGAPAGPVPGLAPYVLAAGALILVPAALVLTLMMGGRTKKTVGETWNCGVPLEPQMEYTATSFAKPIRIIFQSLFQPDRQVNKEFSHFPYFTKRITYHSQIKPVFEDYFYYPARKMLIWASVRIRYLQTGSVHSYLAYIFITLLILILAIK